MLIAVSPSAAAEFVEVVFCAAFTLIWMVSITRAVIAVHFVAASAWNPKTVVNLTPLALFARVSLHTLTQIADIHIFVVDPFRDYCC